MCEARDLPKKHKHYGQYQQKDEVHQAIGKNVLAVALVKFAEAGHGWWGSWVKVRRLNFVYF